MNKIQNISQKDDELEIIKKLEDLSHEEQKDMLLKQHKEIFRLKKELKKGEESIIDIIAKNVEPLSKLISDIAEKWIKIKDKESRFRVSMGIIAVIVVSLIVGVAAFLTYYNRIEGATFTFLLGLIVGYMLTFIREASYPPE